MDEEEKRALEQLLREEIGRNNRIKDEFLATLSHELRTPLNAILGWTHVLLRKAPGGELTAGLQAIERNARAQAQLVEDLLDMNRILSGKLRLDVQPVEVATVAEAAVESVRPSIDAKSIRFHAAIDPRVPPILGDPGRVQQILWNLLTNAVKFTPKGGRIDLVVRRVDSHVEVMVSDTGAGITAEFLPHLFERFRQGEGGPTRSHGGIGLGLSIVKQLVEMHGGTIRAESPGVGKGAYFMVRLPITTLQPPTSTGGRASSSSPPAPRVSLDGLVVLVVDDDTDGRELVAWALEGADAKTLTASSAAEAITLLESREVHVIVSDIGMPDRDGYDLMREVRANARLRTIPAIALTAFARSEDRTQAMLAGYQVHLTKPIHTEELIATVRSLMAGFFIR